MDAIAPNREFESALLACLRGGAPLNANVWAP
jgi:hypothetical protein